MRNYATLIVLLLGAEFLAAWIISTSLCIERREHHEALLARHQNPSPETEAEYRRQRSITHRSIVLTTGVFFTVSGGLTLAVFRARGRRKCPDA